MLDGNQALSECYSNNTVKPFSIEWLHLQRGMDDPFQQLTGKHPNSTTLTPQQDIHYILSSSIQISNISTMEPNFLAHSDHLGIVFDINLHEFFSSEYSDVHAASPWMLTANNKLSITTHSDYVTEKLSSHSMPKRVDELLASPSFPTGTTFPSGGRNIK